MTPTIVGTVSGVLVEWTAGEDSRTARMLACSPASQPRWRARIADHEVIAHGPCSSPLAGSLALTVVDPIRYGRDTPRTALAALRRLQGAGALAGVYFQILDATGPEHDRTYVCAGRAVTADGLTIDVRTHGTGSKAARSGAAIELLAVIREGSA